MITINTLLGIAGAIITIGGAIAVIAGWINPAVRLGSRVKKLEERQQRDYKQFQSMDETQALLCQGMIALIDNQITGNNIEGLKKTKTAMIQHLTQK